MDAEQRRPDTQEVTIPIGSIALHGSLVIPSGAPGVVLFAHGSGSSRFSPRNQFVAEVLQRSWLATLLFDLLTAEEEKIDDRTMQLRFDIPLLTERLVAATDWVGTHPMLQDLPVGYFGASTGGAAALLAAARRPNRVAAVVSRGGRPDLALPVLGQVRAPTLLIVGESDTVVIKLNQEARARMANTQVRLEIIPGASHLFEETGALDSVAALARDWLVRHLQPVQVRMRPV